LFLFGALLLAAAGATALFVRFLPEHEFSQFVTRTLRVASGDWLDVLRILGGLAIAAWGTAFSLLMGWHFLEMNLPARIEELKDYHLEDHLALRPKLIEVSKDRRFLPADIKTTRFTLAHRWLGPRTIKGHQALRPKLIEVSKNRLRFIPADIKASRLTLVRRWLGSRTLKGQVRLLVATATRLSEEAVALATAAREAQAQTITAYLVRGYQYAARGENERAFAEFELAARVSPTDLYSRDIAAGWARCINNQTRERELLDEIQKIAGSARLYVHQARAIRREAELIAKGYNNPAYGRARDLLREAENILLPEIADEEAKREMGRVYTLFCEMRCNLGRPGRLSGPNQPLTRAREYLGEVDMHRRPEEPEPGEAYGKERVEKVKDRVEATPGDDGWPGDDGSGGDSTQISDV
jgi:tetratricopeptide (TPR) repeat protein